MLHLNTLIAIVVINWKRNISLSCKNNEEQTYLLSHVLSIVYWQYKGVEYPEQKQMHDPMIFLNVNLKSVVLKIIYLSISVLPSFLRKNCTFISTANYCVTKNVSDRNTTRRYFLLWLVLLTGNSSVVLNIVIDSKFAILLIYLMSVH